MYGINKRNEIFFEILRISLISIRNLSHHLNEKKNRTLILEWSEMCHTIPSLVAGPLSQQAIKYFLDFQGKNFIEDYPNKDAGYYLEVVGLIKELETLITALSDYPSDL